MVSSAETNSRNQPYVDSAQARVARELAGHIGRIVEARDTPASLRFLARVALAYRNDPWDALQDDYRDGLADDVAVLAHVIRLVESERANCAAMPAASAELFQEAAGFLTNVELPELSKILDRYLVVPSRQNTEWTDETLGRLRRSLAEGLKRLGLGGNRWIDWLCYLPQLEEIDSVPIVALFGRTSSGKTTLAARLLRALSPEYARIADLLSVSSTAHTTTSPLILDFQARCSFPRWRAVGPAVNEAGGLARGEETRSADGRLAELIAQGSRLGVAWIHVVLPGLASQSLRIADLPGTRGYLPGPWGQVASNLLCGADAVLLPMDRRQFRDDEATDLLEVAKLDRSPRMALSLRWVPKEVNPSQAETFRERILDAIVRAQGLDRRARPLRRMVAMSIVEIAARDNTNDDLQALIKWLASVKVIRPRPVTYQSLVRLTSRHPTGRSAKERRKTARTALAALGLFRAWSSVALMETT